MADKDDGTAQLMAFARKHKVTLGIGAGVLLLLAAANGGQGGGGVPDQQGPFGDAGGSGGVDSSGSSGDFDKSKYDEAQRQDDRDQVNRVEVIRGVEKCVLTDGTVIEVEVGNCP